MKMTQPLIRMCQISMQRCIWLILLVTLIGCKTNQPVPLPSQSVNTLSNVPAWYMNRLYKSQGSEILGYGEGESFDEARLHAMAEIGSTLSTLVQSEIRSKTTDRNGNVNKEVSVETSQRSMVKLDDVDVFKQAVIANRAYVVIKYLNLPLAQRIVAKSSKNKMCRQPSTHNYMNSTPIMKRLRADLGCYPLVTVTRSNGRWYLRSGQEMVSFRKNELELLFAQKDSPLLTLIGSKENLKSGELFHFDIDVLQNGYLSLFQVYETGQVVAMINNQHKKSNEILTYPDLSLYEGLEASLTGSQLSTIDLYLAVLCQAKQDFSRFEMINDRFLKAEESYKFGDLLQSITDCAVASVVSHIN